MTVWPQEHDEDDDEVEEKLHTLSDRDYKVWLGILYTAGLGIVLITLLALFDIWL
jgi:hypothetical protein